MLESGDLKKGRKIEIDGEPYVIVQFEFTKPGKGQALYKCKLKNMVTGSQFDRTFRSGEKFIEADLEEQEMEYLYFDGEAYCFMNTSTSGSSKSISTCWIRKYAGSSPASASSTSN